MSLISHVKIEKSKEKIKVKLIVYIKMIFYIISVVLSFSNFLLFLTIIVMLNIPLLRKSIFGRIALDPKSSTWAFVESVKYSASNYLDIFYPKMTENKIPKGIVLFAHGGGWISGYRRQPNNLSWYRYLVKEGFIVATIDYSKGYKASIEKLIDELVEAAEFISRYVIEKISKLNNLNDLKTELNKSIKISLMGLSAGGHLALLAAARLGGNISNVVAYYSPCDLIDIWNASSVFARVALTATVKRLPSRAKKIYEKYSPTNNISNDFPNTLLVHGLKDSVIPYISSVKMFKKLKEKGKVCKLLLHPYGSHGFEFVLKDQKTVEILEKTVQFLEGSSW